MDSKNSFTNNTAVHINEYETHDLIVGAGTSNDRFFVILHGTVEIRQNNKIVRILSEGDVFGLENHYLNRSYTTAAIALSTARIASYHVSTLREIIFDRPQLTEQIIESVTRQLEQTTEVAEENIPLEKLCDHHETVYENGQAIIQEGQKSSEIYRLLESEQGLRVTKHGKEIARIEKNGEFFGEMGPILKTKRSATVTSIGRSVVQIFYVNDLDALLESYPRLSLSIIKSLAGRLHDANKNT